MTPWVLILGMADPTPPACTPQDVIYFAPGGPVRVRFEITIGGKPAAEAWAAAAETLFTKLDANKDGKLDAKERATLVPPGKPQPVRRVAISDNEPAAAPATLFAEKDPPADRAAFLAKLKSAGFGPVKVSVPAARTDTTAVTNALFKLLDRDGDGKLSAAELAAAADRFALVDADENELITAAELLGRPAPRQQPGLFVVDQSEPPADDAPAGGDFLVLPPGEAAAVKALLAARDADKNGGLSAAELGVTAKAFADLDKDANGKLDADELAAWLRLPADVTIPLAFPTTPDAAKSFRFADGRLVPQLATLPQALPPAGMHTAPATVEIVIGDRGNGLFEYLDADGDGQISLRELKAVGNVIPACDANGDGKLAKTELPRLFPVTATFERTVGSPSGGKSPAGPPAWFTKMDRNGDGDVSRKEFLGPAALFRKLDADGDGLISAAEAAAAK